MALPASSTGLGIDFEAPSRPPRTRSALSDSEGLPASASWRQRPRRTLTGPRSPPRSRPRTTIPTLLAPQARTTAPPSSHSGTVTSSRMRSMRGMQGLEGAEVGDAMVSFDLGEGSVREGSRIGLDPLTPGGCTLPRRHSTKESSQLRNSAISLPRDVTLLSFGAFHLGGGAADLKSLLGDSNARLKSGAVILPGHGRNYKDKKANKEHAVALEQAKPRARVEADIVLESNVCVQGGFVRGHIKIRIRKRSKKQSPVSLSEGKIRIVGYEVISDGDERHVFYQCAAPLSSITDAAHNIYCSATDEDGFAQGVEGVHVLPFALHLPSDGSFGNPKGTLNIGSGALIRYIAMVSIRVKDPDTGRRSLAHFYRDCEVWPLLNPCTILQPASRSIQATTNKSMSLIGGASAKVKFNAQLHRLHWPAGSRCPISVHVTNSSKKTIRTLSLTLVRTTTVFRPRLVLDADGDRDPDACQTTTLHKVVAESSLEMGAGVVKGHASAKGWWTGIMPGQDLEFSHFIMLPPDALSVTRARLLEVEYSIRVTLGAGSLASDISVTVPIRIFNFLSIDPPPSAGLLSDSGAYIRSTQLPPVSVLERAPSTFSHMGARPCTRLPTTMEDEEEPEEDNAAEINIPQTSYTSELRVTNPDISPSAHTGSLSARPSVQSLCAVPSEESMYSAGMDVSQDSNEDGDVDTSPELTYTPPQPELHGNLELDSDVGSDEELEAVLESARLHQGQFEPGGTTSSRRSGRRGSKVKGPQQASVLRVTPRLQQPETTPRMEGIGSGMRGTWKKEQERKLLAARLQERARRGFQRPAVSSSSDIATAVEEDSDMPTPRMSNAGLAQATSSKGETVSDIDRPPTSSLQHRNSRDLPLPQTNSVARPAGPPVRHSHMGIIHTPSGTATMPGLPKPATLLNSRSPQKPGLRHLPQPPAVLAMSANVPNATSLRAAKVVQGRTRMTDSEALRQEIVRPPTSPVRPPRSPLRIYGGSRSAETSGAVAGGGGGGPIRQKIMALERRVQTNGL